MGKRVMRYSEAKDRANLAKANMAWRDMKLHTTKTSQAYEKSLKARKAWVKAWETNNKSHSHPAVKKAKARYQKAARYLHRLEKEGARQIKKANRIQKQAEGYWQRAKR